MDELRSLEGIGNLIKKKSPKAFLVRTNSVLPTKKKVDFLDVINHSDSSALSARSYSSRADTVSSIASSIKTFKCDVSNNNDESESNTNESTKADAFANLLATPGLDEEYTNEFQNESNQYDSIRSDNNDLLSNKSLRDMGLGGFGLNMAEIDSMETPENDDTYDDDFNEDGFGLENLLLNFEEKKSETKQILSKENIEKFPIENFADYPSNLKDNKDNASNVNIIGTGSFGIVIKSFHFLSFATVAIKQCRISDDTKLLALFVAESEFYKEFLRCEYVINILGFGINEVNNRLCIALEYMDLQSLARIDYKMDETQLKYVCFSVCSAMREMHSLRCIHNDIKPDNILVNSFGNVKLTDFGCCVRMGKGKTQLTGNVCGSKQYFAPEKWLISPIKYNTKSDVWSFGITMFELVTLTMNVPKEFGWSEPPSLAGLRGNQYSLSEAFCDLLSKMLIYKASERWSAEQLLNHKVLSNKTKLRAKPFAKGKASKKESDLQFMIDSLVQYYSKKQFSFDTKHNKNEKESHGNDAMFSDQQKIENLCKYSGCTQKEVTTMIQFAVANMRKQVGKQK